MRSDQIGELVMEGLKQLDDVAYVRFASVYRNFRDPKDFEKVLGELRSPAGRFRHRRIARMSAAARAESAPVSAQAWDKPFHGGRARIRPPQYRTDLAQSRGRRARGADCR